jgi:hypothetical protein
MFVNEEKFFVILRGRTTDSVEFWSLSGMVSIAKDQSVKPEPSRGKGKVLQGNSLGFEVSR